MIPFAKYAHDALAYDPSTGILRWKEDRPACHFRTKAGHKTWRAQFGGARAGSTSTSRNKPRRILKLGVGSYLEHRVIWMMQTGEKVDQIDHINGDATDNRWVNLRAANYDINMKNKALYRTNKTGHVGISIRHNGRFNVNVRNKYIGLFDTLEEAIAARKAAEADHGFHENHGRKRNCPTMERTNK